MNSPTVLPEVVANGSAVPPKKRLEATNDYIIIRCKLAPEKTEGGIIVPDGARAKLEPEYVGEITDIGPDVKPGRFSEGDRVCYSHRFPMSLPGEAEFVYCFVHERNIMGKVHDLAVTMGGKPTNQGLRPPHDP